MTIDLNLDGVDSWDVSGPILGPGTHVIECVDAQEGKSRNDYPQIELQLVAIAGDEKGGEIRDWVVVTQGSLGKVKQMLLAFGATLPEGGFKFDPASLKGEKAKIVVRREPKQDGSGDRDVVKGYQRLEGGVEQLESEFGATPVDGDPGKEPDVPF